MIGKHKSKSKNHVHKYYQTPPIKSQLKWNTDSSNIEECRSTTIATVRKDQFGRICDQKSKQIRYYSTLLVETLAIREAVIETIKARQSNVIIESESQIAIKAILQEIEIPYKICNNIQDIYILASVIPNIKCMYCTRVANTLADSLTRKAHDCNISF